MVKKLKHRSRLKPRPHKAARFFIGGREFCVQNNGCHRDYRVGQFWTGQSFRRIRIASFFIATERGIMVMPFRKAYIFCSASGEISGLAGSSISVTTLINRTTLGNDSIRLFRKFMHTHESGTDRPSVRPFIVQLPLTLNAVFEEHAFQAAAVFLQGIAGRVVKTFRRFPPGFRLQLFEGRKRFTGVPAFGRGAFGGGNVNSLFNGHHGLTMQRKEAKSKGGMPGEGAVTAPL
jgi:hypothetical protein